MSNNIGSGSGTSTLGSNNLPMPVTVNTAAISSWWNKLQNESSAPVRDAMSRARAISETELKTLQPWTGFFSYGRFSRPRTLVEVQTRIVSNVTHYRTNYAVVFFGLTFYALISNLLLLASLALIGGVFSYLRSTDSPIIQVANLQLSRPQFNVGFGVVTLVLLYIAGATSTIGWLIGAGSVIIASHAALTEPVAEPSTSVEGEFI